MAEPDTPPKQDEQEPLQTRQREQGHRSSPQDRKRVYDSPGNQPSQAPGQKTAPSREAVNAAEQAGGKVGGESRPEKTNLSQYENSIPGGYRPGGDVGALDKLRVKWKAVSKRKKYWFGTGLAGAIISIILAFLSFLPFELTHIKHVVTDEIGGVQARTYRLGRSSVYSTMFFFDENRQYTGNKVGGVRRLMLENRQTKAMVKALNDSGYKVEFETIDGRETGRIKSLTKTDSDGRVVARYASQAALRRAWDIRRSGELSGIMREVFPDKSDYWYSSATKKLYRRWGLTRINWMKEEFAERTRFNAVNRSVMSVEQRFILALRQKLFGQVPQPRVQPPVPVSPDEGETAQDIAARDEQSLGDSQALRDATANAESIVEQSLKDPDFDPKSATPALSVIGSGNNLADAFKKALANTNLKSTFENIGGSVFKSINPLFAVQNACTVKYSLDTIETGARVLRSQQLMGFSLSILNMADAMQNGKSVNPQQINALMGYLNSKDASGKTMFASSGWLYWTDKEKKRTGFANYDKNERDFYSVGGGSTGILADARGYIDQYAKGGTVCKVANNWFVTALGFTVGAVAGVGTFGTSLTAQIVVGVSTSFIFGFINNIAVGVLTPMVAGTVVDGLEKGTAVGNAFVAGAETLNSANAASSGMRPLKLGEARTAFAQVETDRRAELARLSVWERLFSPNQTRSITSVAAVKVSSLNLPGVVKAPFASFSGLFSRYGPSGVSAEDSGCPDTDIKSNDLAATPFCSLIMGIPDSVFDKPELAPDMIDDTINANEQNVDDFGEPIAGSSYAKYVQQCTADGDGGIDIIHTHKIEDYKYTDICSNDLFNVYRLYMTIVQSENDALMDNLEGYSFATTSDSGEVDQVEPVDGDAQSVAKQILTAVKTGQISFNVLNDADVKDGSTPEQNIQQIAAGQPASTTTSCVGRNDSGKAAINRSTTINANLLKFMLELSQVQALQINSLAGQCHSDNSNHYQGQAVDFGCPFPLFSGDLTGNKYGIKRYPVESCGGQGNHYHYSTTGN